MKVTFFFTSTKDGFHLPNNGYVPGVSRVESKARSHRYTGSPNVVMKRKVHFEESGPYQLIPCAFHTLNPRKSEDGAGVMKEF